MTLKSSLSFLAASALTLGLVYAHSRRGRRLSAQVARELGDEPFDLESAPTLPPPPAMLDPERDSLVDILDVDFGGLDDESELEIPIEIVYDVAADGGAQEPYDALSPEELASQWLARATEAAPLRAPHTDYAELAIDPMAALNGERDSLLEEAEFAGRPTEPVIEVSREELISELPPSSLPASSRGRPDWILPENLK